MMNAGLSEIFYPHFLFIPITNISEQDDCKSPYLPPSHSLTCYCPLFLSPSVTSKHANFPTNWPFFPLTPPLSLNPHTLLEKINEGEARITINLHSPPYFRTCSPNHINKGEGEIFTGLTFASIPLINISKNSLLFHYLPLYQPAFPQDL